MADSSRHDARSASAEPWTRERVIACADEINKVVKAQEIADRLLGVMPLPVFNWNAMQWDEEDAPHHIR